MVRAIDLNWSVARRLPRLAALVAIALAAAPLPARQPDEQPALSPEVQRALRERLDRSTKADAAQERAFAAIAAGDLPAATIALREQIELTPSNFVPWYNLACTLAQQGIVDEAGEALVGAVERGFSDRWQLQRDPNLENIRNHEKYLLIVNNWGAILEAAAETRFERMKEEYGPRYTYERDMNLRINLASGFDAESTRLAHDEIRRVTDWAIKTIFQDLADPPMSSTDPWVAVVLPTKNDFELWAIAEYGPAAALGDMNRIGGSYSHDRKQLVAMDLGSTFRHEFLHVLHHRSNSRSGQGHPIWIQEGLCSLVEDYDMVNGELTPTASWRTNSVKRLERAGGLSSIEDLAVMPRSRFSGTRPLANYAYARAVFLFLYQRGKLTEWYEHYTQNWHVDSTGIRSIEGVFAMDIADVDNEFTRWLRALPEVPESVAAGGANLGLDIDPGQGEGPIILGIHSRETREAGLRAGDVLTAVNGRPTRDYHELCRVLGSYSPGTMVTIDYRRRRVHGQATVMLGRATR